MRNPDLAVQSAAALDTVYPARLASTSALPTLFSLLHNPTYAGAYAYGRTFKDLRRQAAGQSKTGQSSGRSSYE
jgi:hypothetical protein